MSVLKVTCITRDELDADRMINAIGGDGFYHTIDEAIGYINSRTHQYWTKVEDESVWLEVGYRPNGIAYLKTEYDDFPPNSLLSFAECESSTEAGFPSIDESIGGIGAIGDERAPHAGLAEQLALKTAVRLLVLEQFGHKHGRLDTMRERAIQRACGAVEHMNIDQDARSQLQEALTRQFDSLFAPPPER